MVESVIQTVSGIAVNVDASVKTKREKTQCVQKR